MRVLRARDKPHYQAEWAKQHRRKNKIKAMTLLGSSCSSCGIKYNGSNGAIFDFHHVNKEEKEYQLGTIMAWSWVKIENELEKCVLLCRNCHALEHSEDF